MRAVLSVTRRAGPSESTPRSLNSLLGSRSALDVLGVGRAIVVGHSFGGAVATRFLERNPERVESLVLLAPAGFGRIRIASFAALPGVRLLVV